MTTARWSAERVATLTITVIYAVWIELIAMRAGEPWELWWWIFEIPFFIWIVAPIVTAYFIRYDDWAFAAGLAAIAGYSLYIYERDMFGAGARSTSALIFIFLPLYQWLAVGILTAAVWGIRRCVK